MAVISSTDPVVAPFIWGAYIAITIYVLGAYWLRAVKKRRQR